MTEAHALWALFASAFTSATILPGTSEVALIAFVKNFPDALNMALLVATVGNTLGGMTTYLLGRWLPNARAQALMQCAAPTATDSPITAKMRALLCLRCYGAWALVFSWVPVIGDALCAAAGWLRLNPWQCAAAMAAGKLARYAVVAGAAKAVLT